jgi:hypothetical protein
MLRVCIYIHVYMCLNIHICIHAFEHTCIHVCTYMLRVFTYIHVYMRLNVCIYCPLDCASATTPELGEGIKHKPCQRPGSPEDLVSPCADEDLFQRGGMIWPTTGQSCPQSHH